MARVGLISFDADQTLFDFARTRNEALTALSAYLAERHGLAVTVNQLQGARNRVAARHRSGALPLLAMRRQALESLLNGNPNAEAIVDGGMVVFEAVRFGHMHLMPDAEQVVRELARQHRLAVVTNGNSDPERSALAGLFEHVVAAEALPYRKPDAAIFEHLFKRADVADPRAVLHVGDSLTLDVEAAQRAGARAVWLNSNRADNASAIQPDFEICRLSELPGLVASLA